MLKCSSEFGPGKPHTCDKATKRDNLAALVRSTSEKSKSSVTVATLKSIADEKGVSTRGGTVVLSSGSKIIPVQIGTSKSKTPVKKFTHEDLMAIQRELNLSDNSIL